VERVLAAGTGAGRRAAGASTWAVLVDLLASRRNRALLTAAAAAITFAYTILLPYNFTQRLSLANWAFLTPGLLAWSLVLGAGMAFLVVVQVHATRQAVAARAGAVGGLAFVASLLPSFLCCTPIIPTLLAFAGLSAVSLYGTTGALQYFFAVHQTPFLVGSLAVLVLAAWSALRKLARAACLAGECAPAGDVEGCGAPSAGDPEREIAR
jgi:hypothetical protein